MIIQIERKLMVTNSQQPSANSPLKGCFFFLMLLIGGATGLILLLFIIGAVTSVADQGPDDTAACVMAQVFVERSLKAPSTAKFPACHSDDVTVRQTSDAWIVGGYVDAQNGFGATIRTRYVVQMTYSTTNDTWHLEDINIIER